MFRIPSFLLLLTALWQASALGQETKYISIGRDRPGIVTDTIVGESIAKAVRLSTRAVHYLEGDWVKPAAQTLTVTTPYFELELKIFTSEPIKPEQVRVLVNGSPAGSKADEASLFGSKHEFTYRGRIALVPGLNKVEIEVKQGSETKRSQPLSITRSQSAPQPVKPEAFVYWIAPNPVDLEGKPLSVRESSLSVSATIISDKPVSAAQVSLLVNDRIQALSPRASIKGTAPRYMLTETLALPPHQGVYKVAFAVTLAGKVYRSEPLLVNFSPFKPNLHVLAIGVQSNLQFAAKDARDMAQAFGSQGGGANKLFGAVHVEALTGKEATAGQITRTIERLKTRYYTGIIDSSDLLVLFISSHGFIAENGDFRLQGDDFDPGARRSTSVSYKQDILDVLDPISCKKVIFIDACHSGGIEGAKASPSAVNLEIEKLNRVKKGLATIVSSQGFELSYEDPQWQNGAFTRALLDGLAYGKADSDRNRIITLQELFAYLSREVPAMVKRVKNQPQTPRMIHNELGNVGIFALDD